MKTISKLFSRLFATTFFQPFFEILHYISLKGMNYGSANSPENSGELSLLKKLSKDLPQKPIIFDVGANNGQYLRLIIKFLSGLNPEIHVFEPDPTAFKRLEKKFEKNKEVILNNFALGEKKGKLNLYVSRKGGVNSSFVKGDKQDFIHVDIDTIDEYCLKHKLKKIDFLKLDVEGYEINVLSGAKLNIERNLIKRVQFEHGSLESLQMGSSLFKFTQLLKNFKYYHIKQNGVREFEYTLKKEIYYNSNYYFVNNSF